MGERVVMVETFEVYTALAGGLVIGAIIGVAIMMVVYEFRWFK